MLSYTYICNCNYISEGITKLLSLHPLPFTKAHCQPKPHKFLWLTCRNFLNILEFALMLQRWLAAMVLGGIQVK